MFIMKKMHLNAVVTVINIANEDIVTSSPRSFSVYSQLELDDIGGIYGVELTEEDNGDDYSFIW